MTLTSKRKKNMLQSGAGHSILLFRHAILRIVVLQKKIGDQRKVDYKSSKRSDIECPAPDLIFFPKDKIRSAFKRFNMNRLMCCAVLYSIATFSYPFIYTPVFTVTGG